MSLFSFSSADILLMAGIFVLVVIYVALVIRLKPSLKSKESTNAAPNSEKQQQNIRQKPARTSIQPTIPVENKEIVEEPKAEVRTPSEPAPPPPKVSKIRSLFTHKVKETPRESGPPGCTYRFGYLGELPKNTPIPDECLGCLKIMECLTKRSSNPTT